MSYSPAQAHPASATGERHTVVEFEEHIMTVARPRRERPLSRGWIAAGAALTVTLAMLTPMPAAAAAGGAFSSSFESADAAPVLTGTGQPVNVTGSRFVPGSMLPSIAPNVCSINPDGRDLRRSGVAQG